MLVEEMKRFKELFFIPILFVCLCCQAKASAVLQDSIQLADSIKTVDSLSLVADTGLVPSINMFLQKERKSLVTLLNRILIG